MHTIAIEVTELGRKKIFFRIDVEVVSQVKFVCVCVCFHAQRPALLTLCI